VRAAQSPRVASPAPTQSAAAATTSIDDKQRRQAATTSSDDKQRRQAATTSSDDKQRRQAATTSSDYTRMPATRGTKPSPTTATTATTEPADALSTYRGKRRFAQTPEPAGAVADANTSGGTFVIQKHWATRLHYDFRLELDGVMKSWAVPKGPSLDPRDKRMAVATEDHPIDYNRFDGQIPAGHYGAGRVVIWDNGRWKPVGDAHESLTKGELKFELEGHKLRGRFVLVRTKPREGEKKPTWLLIKERDAYVRSRDEYDVLEAMPDGVPALGETPPAAHAQRAEAAPAARAKAKPSANAAPARGRAAPLPASIDPQLALAVSGVPADADQRIWEIKLDGYRLMARIDAKGKATLHTRNALDWSKRFPTLVRAFEDLSQHEAWIDGELVALDARGLPSFEALQRAIAGGDTGALVYFAFDLPFVDGEDWRALPLSQRRARLDAIVAGPVAGPPQGGPAPSGGSECREREGAGPLDNIRLSQTFDAPPSQLAAASKAAGLEGLVGKRVDAPYRGGRSDAWVKLKHGHHEEFVIAGFTRGEGMREKTFGALVLAQHDEHGLLRHAGNVGSGFDEDTLEALSARLRPLRVKRPVLDDPNKDLKDAIWVRPELVAQISFAGRSRDGRVRHAVFRGLREDKSAREVERERPGAVMVTAASPIAVTVTNPERVIDPSTGITKIEVVRYMQCVAPLMLEHLASRPVSWLRAPDGLSGQTFFQKHNDRMTMPGVESFAGPSAAGPPQGGRVPSGGSERIERGGLSASSDQLIEIIDTQGLVGAAQMNVIEFHTWNAKRDDLMHPDRVILDLDPGDGVPWPQVQEAALLVRALLQELELPAFLKTSGGKGLHVVVPLERVHDWATMHGFAQVFAQHMARVVPQRFTAISGARNRIGKIYIDHMRNSRGATTVCAWSPRARPGIGVSVPIAWDELSRVTGGAHWSLRDVDERLRIGNGPWRAYADSAVRLDAAIERLV
jgi:bifunctional non-homologous end joining protein LigD